MFTKIHVQECWKKPDALKCVPYEFHLYKWDLRTGRWRDRTEVNAVVTSRWEFLEMFYVLILLNMFFINALNCTLIICILYMNGYLEIILFLIWGPFPIKPVRIGRKWWVFLGWVTQSSQENWSLKVQTCTFGPCGSTSQ